MMTTDWNAAAQAVNAAQTILIVTHIKPDGDAIGSLVGLANALRERGKSIEAAVDDGVPGFLMFLPGAKTILPKLKKGKWDLMIAVDASDEERIGLVGAYGQANSQKVVNLDHHPTNTGFGDIHLIMPEAVSATEVIFEWLHEMGHPISQDTAVPLLTGLVTDTLGFRTSNVRPSTLFIAQQLMESGASLSDIVARTLVSKSYSTIELWRQALQSVTLQDSIIAAAITRADLQQAHLPDATDSGLVGLLIAVQEATIAAVFKELADGKVEISFRSKPGYDVAGVAFSLGGGGHKQASGVTIDGPLDAAQERVMPLLREAVKEGAPVAV
jgi:bifunctional oligoribonuclease and PAP phosphatase NrnA